MIFVRSFNKIDKRVSMGYSFYFFVFLKNAIYIYIYILAFYNTKE